MRNTQNSGRMTPLSNTTIFAEEGAMSEESQMTVVFVIIFILCIFGTWWLNQGGGSD